MMQFVDITRHVRSQFEVIGVFGQPSINSITTAQRCM